MPCVEKRVDRWPSARREEVRAWLILHAQEDYRQFAASLLPGTENLLGVRLPLLRRLAARLAKEDWQGYLAACAVPAEESFEETMLQGMVIGCAPMPLEERLAYTEAFVPKIDNWSVCDSFCSGWKAARENKAAVAAFLEPYWRSEREFDVRFAVVMRLFYYIDEESSDETLALLARVNHPGYYAWMAVAWAVSMVYAAFPERTEDFLRSGALTGEPYRKTLQKILESRQVDGGAKARIRALREETGR